MEVVELDGRSAMRMTFEPGWTWTDSLKPVVGGDRCEVDHFGYCVSGTLHVVMEGGEEFEVTAGDVLNMPAGHDAWVVGDEPWVAIDFQGAGVFAKSSG